MRAIDRLHHIVTERTDGRTVAVMRMGFGAACLAKLALAWPMLQRLSDPVRLRVHYPLLHGEPPAAFVPVVAAAWFLAAVAFTVGWRTRLAGGLLCAAMGAALFADQQLYSNHLYLLITVVAILVLADPGARCSLDARGRGPRDVPRWPIRLLQVQLVVVYLFAALTKLNVDFVSGLVLGLNVRWDGPLAFPGTLRTVPVLFTVSVVTILLELVLAVGFCLPRYRTGAVVLGLLLHTGMFVSTRPTLDLVLFAWMMWTLYLAFDTRGAVAAHALGALDRSSQRWRVPEVLGPA